MYKKEKSPTKMGYSMKMGAGSKYNSSINFKKSDEDLISDSPMMMNDPKKNKLKDIKPETAPESAGPRPKGTNYDPARGGYFPSKKMEYYDKISGYSGYSKAYDPADKTFKSSRKQAAKDLKKVTKTGKMIFKSM